jgi:thiol-disulfide isomerase/thioredoxin
MRLRDAHFFRKVPRDVSESSAFGGLLSIVAVLTIGWLVREEVREWSVLKRVSKMELDHTSMPSPLGPAAYESIRVNLNISMLRIPCAYATLQVADRLGSHKLDGARNVHKVRIDADGRSLGMWSPHRYHDGEAGRDEGDMAEHVFPWHKQMHTQGSADHRAAAEMAGMSEHQKKVIGGVNEAMRMSGGGKPTPPAQAPAKRSLLFAHPGRRAPLFGELAAGFATGAVGMGVAPSEPAEASAPVGESPASAAPLPALPADTKGECSEWARAGECGHNPGFMLSACATSCAAQASAPACGGWVSGGFCERAGAFMAHACGGRCARLDQAPAPASVSPAGGGEGLPGSVTGNVTGVGAGAAGGGVETAASGGGAAAANGVAMGGDGANTGAGTAGGRLSDTQGAVEPPKVESATAGTAAGQKAAEAVPAQKAPAGAAAGEKAPAGAAPVVNAPAEAGEAVKPPADSAAAAEAPAVARVEGAQVKLKPAGMAGSAVTGGGEEHAAEDQGELSAAEQLAAVTRSEAAARSAAGAPGAAEKRGSGVSGYVPSTPFVSAQYSGDEEAFNALVQDKAAVMVNFYAPWCFWSQKLLPAWTALSERLHATSYSQSISVLQIDCTVEPAKTLCRKQAIHAFPSIHVYRGTTHAFEPYEYGRDESVLWLHLVKTAAEVVVSRLNDLAVEERKPYAAQIADISADLKAAMARRKAGLDEDWTDDALTPEEEVAEDKELLGQIDDAASSIMAAKGVSLFALHAQASHGVEAEARAVKQASNEVVLGLLADGAHAGGVGAEGEPLDLWTETEAHEVRTRGGHQHVRNGLGSRAHKARGVRAMARQSSAPSSVGHSVGGIWGE